MSERIIDTRTGHLRCAVENGVATLTLNRPEKRNALSDQMTPALREMLIILEQDSEVRCVVLTGAGRAFCAGGDVSTMNKRWGNEATAERPIEADINQLRQAQRTLSLRLYQLAKPTIAALPGPAAGAGLSIALACDLRIAAESAFVTTAFGNIGFSGDYGGSWFMTQLIGTTRAKELYYTSRRVTAAEALSLGLVNTVVADDDLASHTRDVAESIASGPPIALSYMKENLNRAVTNDLAACLDMEADRMMRCARTEDHRNAVSAFLEKRNPTFSGR